MSTVVLKIAFDGTRYCGMQTQLNALSVQQVIEKALEKKTGFRTGIIAAGRTDSGVHARGMIVNFRVDKKWPIPAESITKALNTALPNDVVVYGSQWRDDDIFHARYDANAREYSYSITCIQDPMVRLYSWFPRIPFSKDLLFESAKLFLGEHDFTTFSKINEDTRNHVCTIHECEWRDEHNSHIQLHIKANRFVYGMVRSLVGAMMDIARKKRTMNEVRESLLHKDRIKNSSLAPAHGLVFENAYYPKELNVNF